MIFIVALLRDEQLIETWRHFFEENYKSELETIALSYPKERSIIVDYWTIDKFDNKHNNIVQSLLDQPFKTLYNAEMAIREIDTISDESMKLHVRIKNLEEIRKIRIRDKNSFYLGKLVSISGVIRKRTNPKPKIKVACFLCSKCGAPIEVAQENSILKEPAECYEDQGGCGRVSTFELSTGLSIFLDEMKLEIQESTEDLQGSQQPDTITVYLEDDLVSADELNPGDRIKVTGILHSIKRRRGNLTLTAFDTVMDANYYDIEESTFQSVDITSEDIEEIKKVASDPDVYTKLKKSIAPSIYGLDEPKEAIIYQSFGSDAKTLPDGTFRRGDIHVLLVGDPGIAKSILLQYTSCVTPKSIFASGSSATGAGLTAAAVRDDFGDGQWTLEAGALVLADMGIACIDELDKMRDEDRNKLHTAMEQQQIPINKAGINTTLPTRTSVLAAANPQDGRFGGYNKTIYQQVNLPATIISRFDLVFALQDIPDPVKDREIAKHILAADMSYYEKITPVFSNDFIRKYVAYAKQNCHPDLSESASKYLVNFYTELRNSSELDNIPITPRQLESIKRLAKASARIQLREVVDTSDVNHAVTLYMSMMSSYGVRKSNVVDIDIFMTGKSTKDRMLFESMRDLLPCPVNQVLSAGYKDEDIVRLKDIDLLFESKGKLFVNNQGDKN